MKLVIIESPYKADTIKKYLGDGYEVFATKGHIRDLPEKSTAVDIENNFEPKYVIIPDKKAVVLALKNKVAKASEIYLATDPDREGEAISWHLENILEIPESEKCRIEFHEISQNAINEAIKNPRAINKNLVDAQQARRVLDRLVGYKLSPYLSRKINAKNLSAGRVQSATLKLIVDREREIQNFKPEEFWNVFAYLKKDGIKFKSSIATFKGKKIKPTSKEEVDEISANLSGASYIVTSVKRAVSKSHPSAPFITSTMQQEAINKLGLTSKRVTSAAQQLYEGVNIEGEGKVALITYIRTDSVRINPNAAKMAKDYIISTYGEKYYPAKPNVYKTKGSAQDAHEAIRPVHLHLTPEKVKTSLAPDQYKLYKLIFERFIASQMAEATFDSLTVNITANDYEFKTVGKTPIFKGFMLAYGYAEEKEEGADDENAKLPNLCENDVLEFAELKTEQKFTKPPARYNESSIVKTMDDKGIGRPATYTPTISNLYYRTYIEKDGKSLKPTELGIIVTEVLEKNFADIVDSKFTAGMEQNLDSIEEEGKAWQKIVADFYDGFEKELVEAGEDREKIRLSEIETDEVCEKCGAKMVIRTGKFGKFLGCSNFPECKNIKRLDKVVGVCPECGKPVAEKKSKKGTLFYGCTGYPDCKFVSWDIPLEEKCPKCNSYLTKKISRDGNKIKCSNEKCDYSRVETKKEGA